MHSFKIAMFVFVLGLTVLGIGAPAQAATRSSFAMPTHSVALPAHAPIADSQYTPTGTSDGNQGSCPLFNVTLPVVGPVVVDPCKWAFSLITGIVSGLVSAVTQLIFWIVGLFFSPGLITTIDPNFTYNLQAVADMRGYLQLFGFGMLTVAIMVYGFKILFSPAIGQTTEDIQSLLPRLAIVGLIIGASGYIGQTVIDLTQLLFQAVGAMSTVQVGNALTMWQSQMGSVQSSMAGAGVAGGIPSIFANILLNIGFAIGAIFLLFLAVQVIFRWFLIDVLLVLMPLAAALSLVPRFEGFAKWYITTFVGSLIVGPLQLLVLLLGTTISTSLFQDIGSTVPSMVQYGIWFPAMWYLATLYLTWKFPSFINQTVGAATAGGVQSLMAVGMNAQRQARHAQQAASSRAASEATNSYREASLGMQAERNQQGQYQADLSAWKTQDQAAGGNRQHIGNRVTMPLPGSVDAGYAWKPMDTSRIWTQPSGQSVSPVGDAMMQLQGGQSLNGEQSTDPSRLSTQLRSSAGSSMEQPAVQPSDISRMPTQPSGAQPVAQSTMEQPALQSADISRMPTLPPGAQPVAQSTMEQPSVQPSDISRMPTQPLGAQPSAQSTMEQPALQSADISRMPTQPSAQMGLDQSAQSVGEEHPAIAPESAFLDESLPDQPSVFAEDASFPDQSSLVADDASAPAQSSLFAEDASLQQESMPTALPTQSHRFETDEFFLNAQAEGARELAERQRQRGIEQHPQSSPESDQHPFQTQKRPARKEKPDVSE